MKGALTFVFGNRKFTKKANEMNADQGRRLQRGLIQDSHLSKPSSVTIDSSPHVLGSHNFQAECSLSAISDAPHPPCQNGTRVCDSSSCGDGEGHANHLVCPSHRQCSECSANLHELANLFTAVLLNAQVLGLKLPPYSHLKRLVREMERNAQRGGALLKRHIATISESTQQTREQAARELSGDIYLTVGCDDCTSNNFPKRDDGGAGSKFRGAGQAYVAERGN